MGPNKSCHLFIIMIKLFSQNSIIVDLMKKEGDYMSKYSFLRKEKKYLVNAFQMEKLITIIKQYMDYDRYCIDGKWYLIRNVYYDTSDNQLIRLSTNKPYYKEKMRIRKYGQYHDHLDTYFLEIKKKTGGLVSKRRVKLSYEELDLFLKDGTIPDCDNYMTKQVLKEFQYFFTYRHVQPAAYITYERLAFLGKDDKTFRLTFDRNLLSRRDDFDFDNDRNLEYIIDSDKMIMEIKIVGSLPLWLVHALSELRIYPLSFSKYGREYQNMIEHKRSLVS